MSIDILGGGFKHFLCSALFGEDSHFDEYFSNGLKPPTSIKLKEIEPWNPDSAKGLLHGS